MDIQETILLSIDKAAYGGYGLAFADNTAVFASGAYPGETISARIISKRQGVYFAETLSVHESNCHRITPCCANYTVCGGCNYLDIDYQYELSLKKSIIEDSLMRIGGIKPEPSLEIGVLHSERLHYRSHARVSSKNGLPGFFQRGGNGIEPLPKKGCLLLDEALNNYLSGKKKIKIREYRIAVDSRGLIASDIDENKICLESIDNFTWERGLDTFFQANKHMRKVMLDSVSVFASIDDMNFADLCCGVGFFSLPLSKLAKSGYGFDINASSIEYAKKNAAANECSNCRFNTASISSINPNKYNADAVVVDPPRAGLSKAARRTICAMNPKRIVYVSCDPATLSRDIRDFLKYGYSLKKLSILDMFPLTYHIESIALLEL
jgi:23S rRNA (uracil1939-C5)-methyltransferase